MLPPIRLTNGPLSVSQPFACVYFAQEHIAYRDAQGNVWDTWYNGSTWNLQQINLGGLTNGPAAVGRIFVWVWPLAASSNQVTQQHFTYRDNVGAIWIRSGARRNDRAIRIGPAGG